MTTAQSNRINAQIAKVTKEINLRNPKLEMEIKSMLKGYQERRIRSIATVRKALKAAVKQDVPVMEFNSAKIDTLRELHRSQIFWQMDSALEHAKITTAELSRQGNEFFPVSHSKTKKFITHEGEKKKI